MEAGFVTGRHLCGGSESDSNTLYRTLMADWHGSRREWKRFLIKICVF